MENLLELADRLWRGETPIEQAYPMVPRNELAEVAAGTAFINTFANVCAFRTEAGLALVDSGSPLTAQVAHGLARAWNSQPLHTAIYSHGHIDHVFGVQVYEEEARAAGWKMRMSSGTKPSSPALSAIA